MCDYSLEQAKSRPAVVGEKLVTKRFDRGTTGFVSPSDTETAVCLLPGTELAFDAPVRVGEAYTWSHFGGVHKHAPARTVEHKVARFAKIDLENPYKHHDGLEFPGELGLEPALLTHLIEGQTATVLQMPVNPAVAEFNAAIAAHNAEVPEYTD